VRRVSREWRGSAPTAKGLEMYDVKSQLSVAAGGAMTQPAPWWWRDSSLRLGTENMGQLATGGTQKEHVPMLVEALVGRR